VRELRNIAERHVLGLRRQTGQIPEFLDQPAAEPRSLSQQVEIFEKCVIEQELAKNEGNVTATGAALGVPVRTLNDYMRKHGLNRKDYK